MIGSNIAKRYAMALFSIAQKEDRIEIIYNELKGFSSMLKESRDLEEFFVNPVFGTSDKSAVIGKILDRFGMSTTTSNFLNLLVDKRRIDILEQIEECYQKYMDDVLNKVRVSVKTAFPLSNELSVKIKEQMEGLTGKNVEMFIDEDPSLLGGVVIGVGDTLYDGSVKSQLNNIRGLIREEM
ncbi:MAG: ATP synthase F1 subunit delta [Thermodesulfobacteriota bacterium]|nr:ATP synthase F1 subunit delta [Thermodesulfobacteriota bacterium]